MQGHTLVEIKTRTATSKARAVEILRYTKRTTLQIIADLVKERIVNDVKSSGLYGIILDETSDITRIEQVSLCLSYCVDGIKKEAFVGFYATKSTEGEVLYQLVRDSISELNLELENIVGKAFDGAANMNGIYKGLSTRMKECSPYAIYVHPLRASPESSPPRYYERDRTITQRLGQYPVLI